MKKVSFLTNFNILFLFYIETWDLVYSIKAVTLPYNFNYVLMKQTKFDHLNSKLGALEQGLAKRLIDIFNELANLRYVINSLAEHHSPELTTIKEVDILDELKDYYLVSNTKVIHVPTTTFFNIELITNEYELESQEEGKFTFKYKGIVVDENAVSQKDHTIEAANEQHAWSLLRELLIGDLKNSSVES